MMMTTGDRILVAMREHRFSGLGAGEIARAATLAESTVRRWLPRLRGERMVHECGSYGWWALSGEGSQRADELTHGEAASPFRLGGHAKIRMTLPEHHGG